MAIVICNEIIEDKRSNNKTLVGLFNGIRTQQLPSAHPRMFVMASFTSGLGRWPVKFRIVDPSNNEIVRMEGEENFENLLEVRDLVFELLGLPLSEEGTYVVDVIVGGTPVAERRFAVQLVKEGQQ